MRLLNCISLLLLLLGVVLLAALSPAAVVAATARREMLMAATGRDRAGAVDSSGGHAPEKAPLPGKAVANDGEDVIGTTRKDEAAVRSNRRRFRTRKVPAASQVYFGGRIPFTADYHSVHRHPPTHN